MLSSFSSHRSPGRQPQGLEIRVQVRCPAICVRDDVVPTVRLVEGAGAAVRHERREIVAAVGERVVRVPVAAQPECVAGVAGAAPEELLVDDAGSGAAGPQPAADEVDHALDLVRSLAGICDAQDAAARLPPISTRSRSTNGIATMASIAASMSCKAR